jgi:transaldolase
MPNQSKLEQLKKMTTVVVDTGDIDSIKKYSPTDATTNPSLIFSATQKPQYRHLIEDAASFARAKAKSKEEERILIMDKVFVNFGIEILKHIPGRVSTEVDAHLSYDVEKSIQKARTLIQLYQQAGIPKERVLIKLAATWEGSRAAIVLEKEGIHCNMTLMFSLAQAIACADVKATLISPFVGRILDWYKKSLGVNSFAPAEDPGVKSVTEIYDYFKKFDYKTQVMGASFRNIDEITELAGCDLLTISPQFLEELENAQGVLPRKLDPKSAKSHDIKKLVVDEKAYRWLLNENPMATDKLAEGIRKFAEDSTKLEQEIIKSYLN